MQWVREKREIDMAFCSEGRVMVEIMGRLGGGAGGNGEI